MTSLYYNFANMIDFETIWNRIIQNENEEFKTKTGLPFTYQISNNKFICSRVNYNISKENFHQCYLLGLPQVEKINVKDITAGPSYVWAVLHDERIRQNDY